MVILLLLVAIMLLRPGLPASGIKGTTSCDNCQWWSKVQHPFGKWKLLTINSPEALGEKKNQESSIVALNQHDALLKASFCTIILHTHEAGPVSSPSVPVNGGSFEFNTKIAHKNTGPKWGNWNVVWFPHMHIIVILCGDLTKFFIILWIWNYMDFLLAWSAKSYSSAKLYSLCNNIEHSPNFFFTRLILFITSKHLSSPPQPQSIILKSPQFSLMKNKF